MSNWECHYRQEYRWCTEKKGGCSLFQTAVVLLQTRRDGAACVPLVYRPSVRRAGHACGSKRTYVLPLPPGVLRRDDWLRQSRCKLTAVHRCLSTDHFLSRGCLFLCMCVALSHCLSLSLSICLSVAVR